MTSTVCQTSTPPPLLLAIAPMLPDSVHVIRVGWTPFPLPGKGTWPVRNTGSQSWRFGHSDWEDSILCPPGTWRMMENGASLGTSPSLYPYYFCTLWSYRSQLIPIFALRTFKLSFLTTKRDLSIRDKIEKSAWKWRSGSAQIPAPFWLPPSIQ